MKIAGKLALITGASSGIGAATARELARRGARVALLARRVDALEAVAAEIRDAGGAAEIYPADLGDGEAVARTAESIQLRQGTPDIVVHGAGAGRWLFVDETNPGEMEQMIDSAEALLLGLRTTAGIDLARLRARYGIDLLAANEALVDRLVDDGLLVVSAESEGNRRLVPTLSGLAVADGLAAAFELSPVS